MRKLFDWLTEPLHQPDLKPEELEAAKKHLEYLERRASLLGITVQNHEDPENGV